MKDDKPHVSYSTDGKGYWWKREWAPQCDETVMCGLQRCQGTRGHAGPHWAYSPCGKLERAHNQAEPVGDDFGGESSTPPGHSRYVSPVDMAPHFYLEFFTEGPVRDPSEIARLERGDMRDGESVSSPHGWRPSHGPWAEGE